jgi:hypothetical protein
MFYTNLPPKMSFFLQKGSIHYFQMVSPRPIGLNKSKPIHIYYTSDFNLAAAQGACTLGIHLRCPGAQVNTLTLLRLAYSLL